MKLKKSIYNSSIKTIGLLLVFSSCNSFLDEIPDNRVSLNDLDKAAQLLTNAYPISSPAFTDWMTDNVGFTRGVTIRVSHSQAYNWEEFFDSPSEQDTPAFFWFETYNAIAHANEVLKILEDLPVTGSEDEAMKKSVESEALLTRAFGHFMLVNLFAKHYDEGSAKADLGVPYVTTPETTFLQGYERNSVQEVYDMAEEDMLRGIELVTDNFFANSGKFHFNRNAALAFASRFYLFKGDYDNCIKYSSEMLGGSPESFVRDLTSQEFVLASSSVDAYPQLYSSPELPSNILMIRKISLVQRLDFAHGPTNTIYNDLFGDTPFTSATDFRENPAFVKGDNGSFPVRYESLFERSSLNSNVGFPYHIELTFRGEEVLLNRAESYIMKNRLSDAIEDLQVLIDRRYQGGDVTLTLEELRFFFGVGNSPFVRDSNLLMDYMLAERNKEFLTQGLRWFDIKRFELEVEHTLADGETTIKLNKKDLRKVLQIPSSAVAVGGLEPNPR